MTQTLTPMIHVPDVRQTAEWYRSLGFEVLGTNEDCGEMNWAMLSFGGSQVMLSAGGKPSSAERREVDLYIVVDAVDQLFKRMQHQVEVVAPPNDTEHQMREFIIRDCNGFWITYGQPMA